MSDDGMDRPNWDLGDSRWKLARERDNAQEEVAACLDALMALQTKYDEDTEDLKGTAKSYCIGMWIIVALIWLQAMIAWWVTT